MSVTRYGQYRAETRNQRFEITKVGATERHPMNWTNGDTTREGAWAQARCQPWPVVYCDASDTADNNGVMELGVVFDPASFERAVYRGYVGYGQSMSDGIYRPIDAETWIKDFRSEILSGSFTWSGNDTPANVRAGLGLYLAALVGVHAA